MSDVVIAYEWSFEGFRVAPVSGQFTEVVREIDWRLKGSFQNSFAECYGTVVLGDPSPVHDFVPLNELTPNQARIWTENALGTELEPIKASILGQIRKKLAPSQIVTIDPPWLSQDAAE